MADIKKSHSNNDAFESVRSRATPSLLVEKFGLMNALQRQAIVDLGFRSLFELKVREVPQKLTHLVLSNFDRDKSDIVLPVGYRKLHVDEEDMHIKLGLSKGRTNIVSARLSHDSELSLKWKSIAANGNPARIVAADVANEMIK